MTLDLTTEEENVLTRLKVLCGGRVYPFIPDDLVIPRDTNGDVLPYITVDFGEPYPTGSGRSLGGGEEQQPHVWVITVTDWGRTDGDTRPTATAVRSRMIGWSPNEANTAPFSARGGGSFADRGTATRPTLAARFQAFAAETNLSS